MWIMNCPFTIKWTSLYYHFLFFWPEKFTGRNLFSALSACVGKWSSSDGDIGANKEMQVAGVGADAGGTVAGRTVGLVAVKLDCASKELLTWALVNVAQPGDLVIALHVLDDSSVTGLTLSFSFSLSISLRYSSLLTVFFFCRRSFLIGFYCECIRFYGGCLSRFLQLEAGANCDIALQNPFVLLCACCLRNCVRKLFS